MVLLRPLLLPSQTVTSYSPSLAVWSCVLIRLSFPLIEFPWNAALPRPSQYPSFQACPYRTSVAHRLSFLGAVSVNSRHQFRPSHTFTCKSICRVCVQVPILRFPGFQVDHRGIFPRCPCARKLNDLSCCTSCFHMSASQHSSVQKSSEPCSKSSPNTGPFCAASRCFAGYLLQNVHTFVAILFILSPHSYS
jgi:hypothetical protein